jgi:signal transduction histidine kinase
MDEGHAWQAAVGTAGDPSMAAPHTDTSPGMQRFQIDGVGQAVVMQDITHLKELDRIKSEFVTTVSHDLRSPLTAILGYVDLIERTGEVSEQQREFIRRVRSSVEHITALISDLLDLGRIEAGLDTAREATPLSVLAFWAVRRYSKAHPEALDLLVVDRAAFAVREAGTDWEEIGFHRPLGGFLFALMLGLILFVPMMAVLLVCGVSAKHRKT